MKKYKKNAFGWIDREEATRLTKELFAKRFKRPNTPEDDGYFQEWVGRISSGHPEPYMDAKTLAVWKKIRK